MTKKPLVLLVAIIMVILATATQATARSIKVIDEITIYNDPDHQGRFGVEVKVTENFDDILMIQTPYEFVPYNTKKSAINACATWLNTSLYFKWYDIDIPMMKVWDKGTQQYTTWIRNKKNIYDQQ